MTDHLQTLLSEIRTLEAMVATEIEAGKLNLNYGIEKGKVWFGKDMITFHRSFKKNSTKYILDSRFLVIASSPAIYLLIAPTLLLDFFIFFYQAICFPIYGIPKVVRKDYFIFDRHKLQYLNVIEKMNCEYCAYFNGLIAYLREVGSRTEQYWCPIRHAKAPKGVHSRYSSFAAYGDPVIYRRELERLKREMLAIKSKNEKL